MPAPSLQDLVPKWSAILEVQDPDGTRTRHPFRHPRIAVGRERDNDLSLSDEGISHQHCEFVSEQGFFVVRDLGSQNGTWLNERRVEEARLRDGDEIRIGRTRIRVALEGKVRRPERRSRWRIGVFLGLCAAAGIWWWLARRQDAALAAYTIAVREQLAGDACTAPQFEALDALDDKRGGRSFAMTLDRGQLKLTKADEALDRELQAIYQRRLGLYREAYRALVVAQEQRRGAAERVSRAGQRLWTPRERKSAAWVDGLLQERAQAVDDLSLALQQLIEDTQSLSQTLGGLLAQPADKSAAERLQSFRFRADLGAARAACAQKDASAASGLLGALSVLGE